MDNDTRIKALMVKVEEQRKALGTKPKSALETNGLFKFENGESLNINTITDESVAVLVLSHILLREQSHQNAQKELNVDIPFMWRGYSIEDWITDLKLCVAKIKYTSEEKKLKVLEAKLANLISDKAKTEMELDDIENLLK